MAIKQVAAAAQVTIGALYHHFPGKDHLYAAVIRRVFAAPAATFPVLAESAPAEQRLREMVEWFVRLMLEDRHFSMLLKRELLDPRPASHGMHGLGVFERPLRQTQLLLRELLPRVNADQAVAALLALLFGLSHLKGVDPLLPEAHRSLQAPRDIAAFCTTTLLRGLGG